MHARRSQGAVQPAGQPGGEQVHTLGGAKAPCPHGGGDAPPRSMATTPLADTYSGRGMVTRAADSTMAPSAAAAATSHAASLAVPSPPPSFGPSIWGTAIGISLLNYARYIILMLLPLRVRALRSARISRG